MCSDKVVLQLENINKVFEAGTPRANQVLHEVNEQLVQGELVAMMGPSGSGKSTLLNIMGLLDTPSSGELFIKGQATTQLDDAGRTALRSQHLGFVFQFHHLVGAFNVLENVLMPLLCRLVKPTKDELEYAAYFVSRLAIADWPQRSATELSGGQPQGLAIARALVTKPALLLADEPTGNLDTKTADEVFQLFEQFNAETGCATLIVTHDARLSARCERVIHLLDGRVV